MRPPLPEAREKTTNLQSSTRLRVPQVAHTPQSRRTVFQSSKPSPNIPPVSPASCKSPVAVATAARKQHLRKCTFPRCREAPYLPQASSTSRSHTSAPHLSGSPSDPRAKSTVGRPHHYTSKHHHLCIPRCYREILFVRGGG